MTDNDDITPIGRAAIEHLERCRPYDDAEITEPIDEYHGTVNVRGCCGGGCWVVQGIKFCPFCGKRLMP